MDYDNWKLENGDNEMEWFGDITIHTAEIDEFVIVLEALEVSNSEIINFDISAILKRDDELDELLDISKHKDFYNKCWEYIYENNEKIINNNTDSLRRM